VNARDATKGDGRVVIQATVEDVDRPTLERHREPDLEPGPFVRLSVRDDGAGMAADVVARAFEPFFTTKGMGQGTGLGLSMVHGIVKQSGGYVHIDSTPGVGTTVSIYLPQVVAEPSEAHAEETAPAGRGETILVVDDEPMVRSTAQRALQAAGYTVYLAPNGVSALDFLATHPGGVDIVLTDIVMPHVNGRELSEWIAQRHPGLPVLFMSGYSGEDIQRRGVAPEHVPFIQKPFTASTLLAGVRMVLDRTK
jgi:two-component system cell cycle sensor histidine kinase/response regulator CckA